MQFLSIESIRSACGGAWARRPDGVSASSPTAGVSIDSRTVRPGEVFFAIRGDRFDGHAFAGAAARAGAAAIVIRRGADVAVDPGPAVIEVDDTRRALIRLASWRRRSLKTTKVVAVTGSAGKTTTVRLIDRVLGTTFKGVASEKSFNNDIGVPLTILRARTSDQYLVCEVGMNAPGEIAALSAILEPDVAVITSIGRAHLGAFEDPAAIVREKGSIYAHLRPGGWAVAPEGVAGLDAALAFVDSARVIRFGFGEGADLRATRLEPVERDEGSVFMSFEAPGRARVETPGLGRGAVQCALAALAVARRFGVEDRVAFKALASAPGVEMRQQMTRVRGARVLVDCYNASPESTLAAIGALAMLKPGPGGRRVLILGDMLELGARSAAIHDEIGEAAARAGVDVMVGVGTLAQRACRRAALCADSLRGLELNAGDDEWPAHACAALREGDVAVLKGSRAMRMERVLEAAPIIASTTGTRSPGGHAVHPG